MQSAGNILANAVSPIDVRAGGSRLLGTAEYVAIEVAVSKIIRSVLRMENRSIWELGFIHLLSVPMLGGAAGAFPTVTPIQATTEFSTALFDGAKGIPATLLAQWVYNTVYKGFHFPWFNFKDLLITAGSKSLSRALVYALRDMLAQLSLVDALAVIDELVRQQQAKSNLGSNE